MGVEGLLSFGARYLHYFSRVSMTAANLPTFDAHSTSRTPDGTSCFVPEQLTVQAYHIGAGKSMPRPRPGARSLQPGADLRWRNYPV